MLDSAQKSMTEMKNGDRRAQRNSISSTDEVVIFLKLREHNIANKENYLMIFISLLN